MNADDPKTTDSRDAAHPGVDVYFAQVASELRSLAGMLWLSERTDHTLQPTALVNEAYLRLAKSPDLEFKDRDHFFRVAAATLRRILIDHARGKNRIKRGGEVEKAPLIEESLPDISELSESHVEPDELAALRAGLARLAAEDERLARVVELRFFSGLSVTQIAETLKVSERTVWNDWRFARARLLRLLTVDAS